MYEQTKLTEARYWFKRMRQMHDNTEEFRYNLSAFLTTARSVLQYALEESKKQHGGERWFASQVSNPLVAFFRDQRNENIHSFPVVPNCEATVFMDDVGWIKFGEDGKVVASGTSDGEVRREILLYRFQSWQGPETVLELAWQYLNELERVVQDGVARGFLTA